MEKNYHTQYTCQKEDQAKIVGAGSIVEVAILMKAEAI
jgi:hypothetical protein